MNEPKTVLILGAGSSVPYGFPTGLQLKEQVASDLLRSNSSKVDLVSVLSDLGYEQSDREAFAKALRQSPKYSIDAFLENRPEFLDIGRASIVATLAPLEKQSASRDSGSRIDGDWCRYLYNHLGGTLDEIRSVRLGVVTFNYDRSFQNYLINAVSSDYDIPVDQSVAVLAGIQVVHVYGCLGPHPVGTPLEEIDLRASVRQLHLLSRSDAPLAALREAQNLVTFAERVCFLGFGFHPANVARLAISDDWPEGSTGKFFRHTPPPRKAVIGTTLGMTAAEVDRARRLFSVRTDLSVSPHDALAFLRETNTFDGLAIVG